MSSSSIIKLQVSLQDAVEEFSFQPLGRIPHVVSERVPDSGFVPLNSVVQSDDDSGFIPSALFETVDVADTADLEDTTESQVSEEVMVEEQPEVIVPAVPPGILLSEEELEHRLRESYESGLQDGKNLAERGLINVFNSLRMASEGLHSMRDRVLRESEDELLKLSLLMARKVILREVAQDSQILLEVVKAATVRVSVNDKIIIRLNPDDYSMVTTHRKDYFQAELATECMSFKSDPTMLSGCCQVDTEMGMIDASFDAQLDEMYRHIQEARTTSTEPVAIN